jgi:hypothetical protein
MLAGLALAPVAVVLAQSIMLPHTHTHTRARTHTHTPSSGGFEDDCGRVAKWIPAQNYISRV